VEIYKEIQSILKELNFNINQIPENFYLKIPKNQKKLFDLIFDTTFSDIELQGQIKDFDIFVKRENDIIKAINYINPKEKYEYFYPYFEAFLDDSKKALFQRLFILMRKI